MRNLKVIVYMDSYLFESHYRSHHIQKTFLDLRDTINFPPSLVVGSQFTLGYGA